MIHVALLASAIVICQAAKCAGLGYITPVSRNNPPAIPLFYSTECRFFWMDFGLFSNNAPYYIRKQWGLLLETGVITRGRKRERAAAAPQNAPVAQRPRSDNEGGTETHLFAVTWHNHISFTLRGHSDDGLHQLERNSLSYV